LSKASRRKTRRQRNKNIIRAAKNIPCEDCGEQKCPNEMTFDHREPSKKLFNLSESRNVTLKQVEEELAKCDVVCRSCHDKREISRRRMNVSIAFTISKELASELDYEMLVSRLSTLEWL
jgi:ribosomal protein L25 (general stress protein Ctc)